MKFKNTKKSPEKEAVTTSEKNDEVDKDEIKEIVEETVQEVLKEKEKKGEVPTVEASKKPVVTPIVGEEKNKNENTAETEAKSAALPPSLSDTESSTLSEDTPPVASTVQPEVSTPAPVVANSSTTTPQPVEASAAPVVTNSDNSNSEGSTDVTETEEVRRKSPLLKILILILILLVLGFGYYYLSTNNMLNLKSFNSVVKKPSAPSKAPVSEVTPTKAVDLSAYNVSVLNGSGVAGEAAKVKTSLTDAGFTVVSTGNADSTDVTDTIISVKSKVNEAYITKLSEELGKTYKVSTVTKKLDDSETADVIVTIGSNTK